MATFVYTGQDANNTANADTLVVNDERPITFTIDSGAENYVGDDPNTGTNEAADDLISYTDYDGNVYTDVSFIVTYEGYANWSHGNSFSPPELQSHIAVIEITSGPETGQTYTLILENPPDPNVPNPNKGTVDYTYTNGNHRATPAEDGIFCFAEGSMISTPDGDLPVESLEVGDLVFTADHGAQPIRWIGCTTVSARGENRPVRFEKDALGKGMPYMPLLVSPAHRMLLSGVLPDLLFGESQVLAYAADLMNDSTIRPARDTGLVRYFHILFDRHEVVFANGAPAESFHPDQASEGPSTRRSLEELRRLFPERFEAETPEASAHPTLAKGEARLVASGLF